MSKSFGPQTLLYPAPVWVIGTFDRNRAPNVMTIAWGGICSSKPPCVAVSIRKATYSHAAILDRRAFTVNIPSAAFVKQADYFGIVSGRDTDKFRATGLTAVEGVKVDAPFIKEFPVVIECKLIGSSEIGIHTHFIGEIMDVRADEAFLDKDGMPDMAKVGPVLFSPGGGSYYAVGSYLGEAYTIGKEIKGK
jgi:flavin reductase (DIM6/NTAB) family NADH-FMN oxidoreductase RutF